MLPTSGTLSALMINQEIRHAAATYRSWMWLCQTTWIYPNNKWYGQIWGNPSRISPADLHGAYYEGVVRKMGWWDNSSTSQYLSRGNCGNCNCDCGNA